MTKKAKMTVVNDEPQPTEELIKRTPVDETPFVIISIGGKHFGTFGQYRITEERETLQEVEEELYLMTWNRIIQIMTLVNQMLNNSKN